MTSDNQLLTVAQVAKMYHVANQTIYRHIKSGKLSKDSNGKIALSECLRVYGAAPSVNSNNVITRDSDNVITGDSETINLLKQQITFLQSQLELANEREVRLMALLENKSGTSTASSSGTGSFFGSLFGGKK